MKELLGIIYIAAGWWAINKVWYSKRVYLVNDSLKFYLQKFLLVIMFGWALIPIAVIMLLLGK
jgi:hypothetical protein